MLKWIIELLKRIFMNPETTDKTTEDTNVQQKKVLVRGSINLGNPTITGSYYDLYNTSVITYQKAGNNNYTVDCYLNATINDASSYVIYPANHCLVYVTTGAIHTASKVIVTSSIGDTGGGVLGNILNIVVQANTLQPIYAGTNWIAYYLIYSARFSSDTVL